MREKRLPQTDADAGDEREEPTKRPRTRFVELQPAAEDPADAIDEEIPGSARADVEPLVLADAPFDPFHGGDPALTTSHTAGDPGFARAQRAHLRRQQQDQGALADALRAQEKYDQPEEERNEAGDPMEPFHLRKEMEEGVFDPAGAYIEYERQDEQDAWLDSIEDQVHGTGPDRGRHLPYANEPVAEPPPLKGREVLPFMRQLLDVLQHGETVPAALRRLAGAGPVLTKFGSKEEARQFFEERVRSGHAVPAGNWEEFQALTEAAEVLFDAGQTDVYTLKREQMAHRVAQEQDAERAPPAASPTTQAAAEAAAELGATEMEAAAQELEAGQQLDMIGSPATNQVGTSPANHEQVLAALLQQQAAATPEGRAAIQAALHGSFGGWQAAEPGGQAAQGSKPAQHAQQAQQAQQAQHVPQGKAGAAVAFDNEAANLAGGEE
ncbi:hypothetical protein COHA_008602 [Chlorella ohadii]|uniref:Uncharacterized protein n=1 Tax=Chlorella ohadii TaxID=2649997 RepID=A0AAD5GYV1_9CHLO|nr:hypothetical protein COHA_008602 [Chlorella ohadii]